VPKRQKLAKLSRNKLDYWSTLYTVVQTPQIAINYFLTVFFDVAPFNKKLHIFWRILLLENSQINVFNPMYLLILCAS